MRSGIHPDLSGRQNVYLYGNILGLSRAEIAARFDDIVDFAEIGDAIDRQVKFYSTGMAIRLGFAIAAFLEPDILLVDEVLAVGDARFQQKCLERISQVVANGTTLFYVSHDLPTVEAVCDRAMWLADSYVRADGPARDVVNLYRASVEEQASLTDVARHRGARPQGRGHRARRRAGPVRAKRSTSGSWRSPSKPCSGRSTSGSPRARPCRCSSCATPAPSPRGSSSCAAGCTACRCPRAATRCGGPCAPRAAAGPRPSLPWQPLASFEAFGPIAIKAPVGRHGAVPGVRARGLGAVLTHDADPGLDGVTAVVVTHLRPRLAGATVRSLLDVEGFAPDRVVVVVNGEGGLDDPELEKAVRMVRLPSNTGPGRWFPPAGCSRRSPIPTTRWAYLCEDDMVLLHLPTPACGRAARPGRGRAATTRSGRSWPSAGSSWPARATPSTSCPAGACPGELAPVDVSTWGATLVSRAVVDAGVLPDPELFFGFEDFDFYCRVRAAGFSVLVDVICARQVAHRQTSAGRDDALRDHRPIDADEPWRAYYLARNYFALARRHGRPSWFALAPALLGAPAPARPQRRRAAWPRCAAWWTGPGASSASIPGTCARWANASDCRRPDDRGPLRATATPVPGAASRAEPDRRRSPTRTGARPRRWWRSCCRTTRPHALARCLEAIAAQTVRPGSIIVVDNASEPPVRAERPRRPSLPVSVVRSDTNLGPAGGWALAFEELLARRGRLRLGPRRRHRGRPRVPRDPPGRGAATTPRRRSVSPAPSNPTGPWGSGGRGAGSSCRATSSSRWACPGPSCSGGPRTTSTATGASPRPGTRGASWTGRWSNTTPCARRPGCRCGSTTTRPGTCCISTSTSCTVSAGTRGT